MKKLAIAFIFMFSINFNAQTIQVYHGASGSTAILKNGLRDGNSKKISFNKGDEITIEIINSHPALYSYEFNNEEIEITDPESPDLADLLSVLTSNLSKDLNANKRSPVAMTWSTTYRTRVDKYIKALKDAIDIIKASDTPKNISDAFIHSNDGGYTYAQKELKKLEVLKEKDIKSYTDDFINKIKIKAVTGYKKSDIAESNLMALYDTYLTTLSSKLIEIKKSYGQNISSIKRYTIILNDKTNKITLNIKSKNDDINMRDTGDKLITVEVIPFYDRPILEFMPLALLHKSQGGKKFSIENGIINESENEEFDFSVGAMLNLNLINWGENKEYSLATGIGFALSEDTLDNFFISANVSYRKWARFGIGYGFLRTSTGLKNGLSAGDTATNIENIADVISFERKPALFFTFVIPGLSLPISK